MWPVRIDPSQIDQIMANLCVNARDAISGVGRMTIETENISFDEAYCDLHPGFICGSYVMITVADNGCGMSKEVLDNVFEPFFTTKEHEHGTGLGLATEYAIVKQNEGYINVHSEPNQGATFKIYLPKFSGDYIDTSLERETGILKGRGETLLLVEDEPMILKVSRSMLEGLGYRVLTASSPSEALREAKAHVGEIQLLITDVIMPEMNGRNLANAINEIIPGLKCMFSSGYTADVIAYHGVLDEGVNFIQKPFSIQNLSLRVRETLGS